MVLGMGVSVAMSAGVALGAAVLLSGSCGEVMLALVGLSDPAGAVARTSAAAAAGEVTRGAVAVLGGAWAAVIEGTGVGLSRAAGRNEAGGRALGVRAADTGGWAVEPGDGAKSLAA